MRFGTRAFQISIGHTFVHYYVFLMKMPAFGI